jgi:hypothetical protein
LLNVYLLLLLLLRLLSRSNANQAGLLLLIRLLTDCVWRRLRNCRRRWTSGCLILLRLLGARRNNAAQVQCFAAPIARLQEEEEKMSMVIRKKLLKNGEIT